MKCISLFEDTISTLIPQFHLISFHRSPEFNPISNVLYRNEFNVHLISLTTMDLVHSASPIDSLYQQFTPLVISLPGIYFRCNFTSSVVGA